MIFDGMMADGLAKMGDSLNISMNALMHNFENQEFWQGFHAAFMQAHFSMLWDLATAADGDAARQARRRGSPRRPMTPPAPWPRLLGQSRRKNRKNRISRDSKVGIGAVIQ